MTDMLEADLKGDLPIGKRLSTFKPEGDKTVQEEDQADSEHGMKKEATAFGRSVKHQEAHLKPTSLLSYLGKRPKLVSFYS